MNRAERRRHQRAHGHARNPFPHDADVAVQPGWCADTAATIEEAKQLTHDALIRQLGDRRLSGVQWSITRGEDAEARLSTLWQDASLEEADVYRRIRAHLREYGGCLVLAMAQGQPTKRPSAEPPKPKAEDPPHG